MKIKPCVHALLCGFCILFSISHASAASGQSRPASLSVNVMDFGAIGNNITDDTASIQRAIDSLGSGGGSVTFPPGHTFRCASRLVLDDRNSIHLSGSASNFENNNPTLIYTGSGPEFISLRSSHGVHFANMDIRYSNPAFTGNLVTTGKSSSGRDPSYMVFESCAFMGTPSAIHAKSLLRLQEAIVSSVHNCLFIYSDLGILGRDMYYSNAITVDGCAFARQNTAAIKNAGEAWLITGCTFEPLIDAHGAAYTQDLDYYSWGLSFIGNWAGDFSAPGGVLIKARSVGFTAEGNRFALAEDMIAIQLHKSQGVSITGNRIDGGLRSVAVDFGALPNFGIHIAGNDFEVSQAIGNLARANGPLSILANTQTNNLISNGGGLTVAGEVAPQAAAQGVTMGRSTYITGNKSPAIISWLDSASGYTNGSLGIQPSSLADTTQIVLLTGSRPTERAVIDAAGLKINGSLTVTGSLTKGSGAFLIDHPLDPSRKSLRHGFVEAPRYDLIYRGEAKLSAGVAQISIDDASHMTRGTFDALTQNPQVFLQNLTGWEPVKATVTHGTLSIICRDKASKDTIGWMVVAERNDPFIRSVDNVDGHGHLVPEADKPPSTGNANR